MQRILNYTLVTAIMAVGFVSYGVSQNSKNPRNTVSVINHEKKIFSDESGRVYWNLELPVYFTISSKPNGEGGHELKEVKDGQAGENANPMYFNAHGVHYIRYLNIDKAGSGLEVSYVVYVDGKKPVSKISFLNAKKYDNGDRIFYGKNLSINIVARDEMSGVDKTLYAVNSNEFISFKENLEFKEEISYEFKCYTVDRVGNAENLGTYIFDVDLQAPVTKHQIIGDKLETILSPKSLIRLSAVDNLSGIKRIRFYFDNTNEGTYGEALKLNKLSEGEHKITFNSLDNVDNQEESTSYTFYLDKTPPEISTEIEGDLYEIGGRTFVSERTKLTITARDNKAGLAKIYYTVDGKQKVEYIQPISVSDFYPGVHRVAYKAIDKVNNETIKFTTNSRFSALNFDNTAPKLSFDYQGTKFLNNETFFITSRTKIKLTASDLQSGVQKITYKIDDGNSVNYTQPFLIKEDGMHSITVQGFDNVNNKSNSELLVAVDNVGPEISFHLNTDQIGTQEFANKSKKIPVYPKHAKLYLEAVDQMVGIDKIYYSTGNTQERLYTGPIPTRTTGLWSVKVRAIDKLGNSMEIGPVEFVIQ